MLIPNELPDDLNSTMVVRLTKLMHFKAVKCHSLRGIPHLPDKQIQFDYSLHQQKLEQIQSAKYLGITITDNLDWGQHISEISSKAPKTIWH